MTMITTTIMTTATMTTIIAKKSKSGVGCLTLNRPAALNALDLPMFEAIGAFLDDCAGDATVREILIRGNGPKGFCAGGDVKKLTTEDAAYGQRFFELEYGTDHELHRFPKPVTTIAHGVTMGGGLGLFTAGRTRVIAEDAVLAMPEVSIGFFTDVGATWFFNQAPGLAGLFLGMTGGRFGAYDALYLGLADFVIPRDGWEAAGQWTEGGALGSWLKTHALMARPTQAGAPSTLAGAIRTASAGAPGPGAPSPDLLAKSWIARNQAWIDQVCAGEDSEAVYQRLMTATAPEPAIAEALANLKAGSPDSARLIHRELRAARGRPIGECFARELELALGRMTHPEFREGVRARLIDKDHRPRWAKSV